MKKYVFAATFLWFALNLNAADITIISNAFASGNAASLAKNMAAEVDFAMQGKTQKTNAAGAVAQLSRFFETNAPTGFTVAHNADKKESGFLVGKLATNQGEFRVNVAYTVNGDQIIIQSIRIE